MIISSPITSIAKSGSSALTGAVTLSQGTNVTLTQSGNDISIAASAGAATPAGSDTQVQFNDGGSFGGDAGLTYDKTNDTLTISGSSTSTTPVNGLLIQNTNTTTNNGAWLRLSINRSTPGQIIGAAIGATQAGDFNHSDLAIYTRQAGSLMEVARFDGGSGSPGTLSLGIAGTRSGGLKINGSTSGTITINPAAAAGTYTLTLPTDDGTAGQFLQTDGSGVCSWATASATPQMTFSTVFETSARWSLTTAGTGTATFDTAGLTLQTGATAGSFEALKNSGNGNITIDGSTSYFSCAPYNFSEGTDYQAYIGVGNVTIAGTGITFTPKHYGFKSVRASSSTTFSATNADGTTETATSFAQTLSGSFLLHAIYVPSTNIKYYSDRVLKATHTTNLPTSMILYFIELGISNASTASSSNFKIESYNFSINAE